MKKLVILSIIAVTLLCLNCSKDEKQYSPAEEAVIRPAKIWLKLLDEGQFSQSWQITNKTFKNDVSEKRWIIGMEYMRAPFGNALSREIEFCRFEEYDADAGYHRKALIKFQTTFEDGSATEEFVELRFDGDLWRVSAYYLDR